MTLILTKASSDYVLQMSDRRITAGADIVDPQANKGLIYACEDAIVAVAYTGMAVLDDAPTDQWLAERVTGVRFDRTRKVPAFPGPPSSTRETIGQTLTRIADALKEAATHVDVRWRESWKAMDFDVVAAGWQWNRRGRHRPIVAWISKSANTTDIQKGYRNRLWHYPRSGQKPFVVMAAPSVNYTKHDRERLISRLQDRSLQECESVLIEETREVSTAIPQVGRDLLSITLMPPPIAQGFVFDRLEGTRRRSIMMSSFVPDLATEVAITPWLIGPDLLLPPAELSQTTEIQLGPYKIHLAAPDANGVFLMGGLRRPKL